MRVTLWFFFSDGVCRSDLQPYSTFQIKATKTYVLFIAIALTPTKYNNSSWYISTLFSLIFARTVFSRTHPAFILKNDILAPAFISGVILWLFLTTGLSSSTELTRGPELQNYTNKKSTLQTLLK